MDNLPPKQPNFFDKANPFGQCNHRNVEDYLVDSIESGVPGNITNIQWGQGPNIEDVIQGNIGDCWLISSIQSLLESGKEQIKNVFKHVVVNKQGNPKWVVLKLYPIKLWVEYNPKNKKEFKIVSIPKPTPVDIHVNIKAKNITKELGQRDQGTPIAADWVKYLEMGFKDFYRKKYITFVGDAWETDLKGANYIYRHLNDALMGLRTASYNGKEIQNNIEYGYPFVGVSVLSGKKMESSWMDVAMGYEEDADIILPVTGTVKKNKDTNKTDDEAEKQKSVKKNIKLLNSMKQYAKQTQNEGIVRFVWSDSAAFIPIVYDNKNDEEPSKKVDSLSCPEYASKNMNTYYYIYQIGYTTLKKKITMTNNLDAFLSSKAPEIKKIEQERYKEIKSKYTPKPETITKRAKHIISSLEKQMKYADKETDGQHVIYSWEKKQSLMPLAFMGVEVGLMTVSHVEAVDKIETPIDFNRDKATIEEKLNNYYLKFKSTGANQDGTNDGNLHEILKRDPTFNIISEDKYEKRREHSVEKSKKNPYKKILDSSSRGKKIINSKTTKNLK